MKCEGCVWWDDFSWVCACGSSPNCADFVNEGCLYYERSGSVDSCSRKPADVAKVSDAKGSERGDRVD